jgi:multidrug efflux pump subunit AcrB
MKRAIAWFAENSVAANLLMFVLLGAGLLTLTRVKLEVFPELAVDVVTVSVAYPGAAPAEVEEGICVRVEEELQGLQGVKRISSSAAENVGVVRVEVTPGTDVRKVLDEVKSRVDGIANFPAEAEKPVVQEVVLRSQVINVAVWGDADERTLKRLGERVRDDISALPGITYAELSNVRPYEIAIEVSEAALRRHGLSFDEVVRAVRASSLDLPGGSLRTEGGEILLRTKGQAYRGGEFEALLLWTRPDGSVLRLGDVATVVDGFAETDQRARFDGMPAVLVQVFRVGDQSAIAVAAAVHEYVAGAASRMPEGIELTTWKDDSKLLESRLDLLLRNARSGLILVFIVLALFLRLRLALWVSLGIPISFLGTIWLMPAMDVSVNLISLFAFILVLGIVVDDAIIVGENIHTHAQSGKTGLRAAIDGAQEIAVPVVFAVLTTVAAFVPLLSLPGATGKVWRVIPLIVIPSLVFSLVESLFVLPAHLAHDAKARRRGGLAGVLLRGWEGFQGLFASGLMRFVDRAYRPSLRLALRWRYLTLAAGVGAILLTAGLVGGGRIPFVFMPNVEADFIVAQLTMPQGTPVEVTEAAVRHIEQSAERLRAELDGKSVERGGSVLRHMLASIGDQPYRAAQSRHGMGSTSGYNASHLGEVMIELAPAEQRSVPSSEMAVRWRELTGAIPDAVELAYTASLFSAGKPIDVQLTGADLGELRSAADALKAQLTAYGGVIDVADSYRAGKQEVQLALRPAAEPLGLTLMDLARQVRQGFHGEEAQRLQRGRDDVRVMVRYPAAERRSMGDLEQMRIRTPAGAQVPFAALAEAAPGRGYASIQRVDRRRAVNVTADVDQGRANANEVLAALRKDVLPLVLAEHPGVRASFEGEHREQAETFEGLGRGLALALLLVFALLAVPLRSYVQPAIVMSAIPFGMVGAVLGHLLMGMELSVLSLCGMVALAGVVVNDSLVMVDFINRGQRRGMRLLEAVSEAGAARFRPILLTSMTTFAGLAPLVLFEKSMQARFLVPMGVSLAFGVMFSTLVTLMIVPSLYLVLEDLREAVRWLFAPAAQADSVSEPEEVDEDSFDLQPPVPVGA